MACTAHIAVGKFGLVWSCKSKVDIGFRFTLKNIVRQLRIPSSVKSELALLARPLPFRNTTIDKIIYQRVGCAMYGHACACECKKHSETCVRCACVQHFFMRAMCDHTFAPKWP